ncbi:ABC transporter ATP-binding protein [Nocardioides taihuensis]|uniref:ABC transporter ATP-binding protein n=1 Tax=Nocardioides taihuensis TaxID=1835606 RepID=A0ABW0BFN3_9ACTN
MSTLHLEGVRKAFGATVAVDGVDLVVPEGSVTAVLGPSGCGKTTLLRLVAGFLEPDAGTIAFDDRVVAGSGRPVPPQQRRVGYVPQEGALFPHLDVAANIAFGLPRAQRRSARVGDLLDLVELPAAYGARHPHELSGGQQQRVALARALAPNPSVVLLDEPFSSLDASLRASTGRAVVRALHAAGATAVLVTHDQDEALSLADQVAVMRAGRLVQAASPHVLYRTPADADVARFVGGAAVLDATVRDGVARCALGDLLLLEPVPDGTAEVLVRPEQLRLGDDGPVAARVVEVSFYGHDAAVTLDVHDGPTVVARVTGLDAPEAGREVGVSVTGRVLAFTPR